MYKLIRDLEDFSQGSINPHLPGFCDTETCIDEGKTDGGLYGKVRLLQLMQKGWEEAIIFDCFFVPLHKVLELIKPLNLVFHGGAYDLHTINRKTPEVWLPKDVQDTLYLSRMMWPTKQKFGFHYCLKYANLEDALIKGIDKKEEQKSDWGGPLTKKQLTYAASDVIYLERLYNKVKVHDTTRSYRLDTANLKFAVEYTRRGMPVNQDTVKKLKKKYLSELEVMLDKLPINPRSSVKAREYLGTKSSSKEVLLSLSLEGDEKATLIMKSREHYKSLESLNKYDRPVVKGFFQPCAALSGRFSCTGGNSFEHANLQQLQRALHEIIEAPPGWKLVYKDYSGVELRMATAYTGEPLMAGLLKSGADMHVETARYLWNEKDISDHKREVAKVCNYGLLYGAGVKTFRETLRSWADIKVSFPEAKDIMGRWFETYSYFKEWHSIFKRQLSVYGYVDIETALGRKVRTYRLNDALNIPIQGSSAEVQKTGLMILQSRYPKNNLIDTIHDSNILLEREDEAEKWGERLNECMVEAWHYVIKDLADPDIPMPGGYSIGQSWSFH